LHKALEGSTTREVRIAELPSMRAAFATSAAVGVRAVLGVDDLRFPYGDSALAPLREAYAALPAERP
ncbi:aminotransferase, partial [Streptomyces broussonetiae]